MADSGDLKFRSNKIIVVIRKYTAFGDCFTLDLDNFYVFQLNYFGVLLKVPRGTVNK